MLTHSADKRARSYHGLSKTLVYKVWQQMISRCEKPGSANYERYGARGIAVCDRWHSFENFIADMGERPPGHSIDRIDNNGNYEPSNCRWATRAQQGRNRRNNHLIPYKGQMMHMVDVAADMGISHTTLLSRLKRWSLERVLEKCK